MLGKQSSNARLVLYNTYRSRNIVNPELQYCVIISTIFFVQCYNTFAVLSPCANEGGNGRGGGATLSTCWPVSPTLWRHATATLQGGGGLRELSHLR